MKRSFEKYAALIGIFIVFMILVDRFAYIYRPHYRSATCPIKPGPNEGLLYDRAKKGAEDCVPPLCSVSAVNRNGNIYTLATTGHCVAHLDANTGDTVLNSERWFVSFDGETYIKAKAVSIGDLGAGDNWALLEVESPTPLYISP